MREQRDHLLENLRRLNIPQSILTSFPALPTDTMGVMAYGSRARGDALPDSDLDVLILRQKSMPSIEAGLVSVSFYTPEQMKSGIGTLFGAHLKRDGVILQDQRGHLARLVNSMGEVDTERLLARAKAMSCLFTTLDRDLPRYLPGLTRQARYLLRSCLYAQAISEGKPCFSVRELAVRYADPVLSAALASRHDQEPTRDDLDLCISRLRNILGTFPKNVNGSLEATIVNEWNNPGDLLSMAFLVLGISGKREESLDQDSTRRGSRLNNPYAEVDRILL